MRARVREASVSGCLAIVAMCSLTVGTLGLGNCRKPTSERESSRDLALPASATSVGAPAVGLATGTPVVPPTIHVGAAAPASLAPLVKTVGDAVVTIVVKVKGRSHRIKQGLGSGFLIDNAGTILTNNHVVAEANAIEVILSNDKILDGKVIGTDPATDVAIVKIDPPEGLVPIVLGDSDTISVGDSVVAIGNPLGLSHTVTSGILSAKGRTTKDVPIKAKGADFTYFDFLQTDAAINPGNSGGPLLNLKGEAIGINTAINAAGQGLAFAIPINMVKQMIPSLVKEGKLVRSFLGIGVDDAPRDDKTGLRGVVVRSTARGTPAEKAGLKAGDRLVAIDGAPVRDASQFRWLISIAGVGRSVTLRVLRGDKAFDLPVTLGRFPERPARPASEDDEEDD